LDGGKEATFTIAFLAPFSTCAPPGAARAVVGVDGSAAPLASISATSRSANAMTERMCRLRLGACPIDFSP
jgi:hypothetical protein